MKQTLEEYIEELGSELVSFFDIGEQCQKDGDGDGFSEAHDKHFYVRQVLDAAKLLWFEQHPPKDDGLPDGE